MRGLCQHRDGVGPEMLSRRWLDRYVEQVVTRDAELDDAAHLRWLRDHLGDRFVAGVVLHIGPRTYRLDDRLVAAPIAALAH